MARRVLDGRYRLTERLGIGGMGEVWRGVDERLDRPVAVKLVRPELVETDDTVARFRREARVTARLAGHPNIVILYDYGTDSDTVYAVMELVEGLPLNRVLRDRGPLPVPLAARWGAQVCAGLSAAHTSGIVHRDIKPGNLMAVGSDAPDGGTVKVLDFGIAGFHEAALQSRRLTRTGDLIGTPLYMSPEQIQALPVGAPGDLYSFGAVLFQMLTGRPPFEGRDPMPVLRMHLMEPPPPPSALRPDLPPELAGLVLALLAKAPGQRPGSADEVRARLLSFAAAEAPAAREAAPARRPTEPVPPVDPARRRRLDAALEEARGAAADGDLDEAVRRVGALLDELDAVYGAEHPESLKARRRHAYLTGKAGYPDRAAALLGELLPVLDRVYGRGHPETQTVRHYQAVNTGRAGRRAEAAAQREDLLVDLVAAHGPDSSRVLTNRLYLAFDVGESGDHPHAVALLEALVPDMARVLGPDASDTLTARHYLAAYTGFAGRPHEAARHYHELLADHIRLYGAADPRTARTRSRLTRWQDRTR
ncbi:serine/threonine-protein kinase [Actinorugispora endophytica]|uniref:non-specific serine/threonine protein kinase n=1 Tax=Actinorugispora endophytica TaxID=1605990 RepID=A0A4V3D8U7_9ACTN|nr:serine/threonine-protein kinase [Actinorugispora endophytica]TDQ53309.1 serine/threonine protein kinase [Actinorugispora endophytica]